MASEPDERTDVDLLAAHVAGDAAAFGTLFARHRDRLWAVALRTCGDPETAADGLQDGLVAAFRRAGSFRGDAAVTTWLHRVVVNACLDRLRAQKVRRAEPLPEDVDGPRPLRPVAGDPVGPGVPTDPADHSLASERRRVVLSALGELSPEQRAAVVLVDMEGYSVAEAAQVLDCAEGTVKSRCSRARARLAVLLADVLDDAAPKAPEDAPGTVDGNPAAGPDVGSLTRRGPPAAGAGLAPQAPTVD
ncbi:RNA polymerase sigma factor SigM [Nocardioides sp. J54]|uniref:RNA polymerase sigma factor SigM n=1 Tax=Nocardioides sp. J54 TaxID=935866 RepID=UPI0004AE5FB7|nr:RNA polymerase sigma factor SigM [Nocardioides sp. J54]